MLLTRVDEPRGAVRALDATGQPLAGVLVEGERTGHAHRLPGRVYDARASVAWSCWSGRPSLAHEEHRHVEVPAGWWQLTVQREYMPAERPRRRRD